MSRRGHTDSPDALQKEKFIVPAVCAAESHMKTRRLGINGQQRLPKSSYAKLINKSHRLVIRTSKSQTTFGGAHHRTG